jgi:hypothetical protein
MSELQVPSFGELNALAGEHLGLVFEDDPEGTVKLAVIGLTLRAWRNTSLEDLHAGSHPGGGFSDGAMLRFNVATTRAISEYVTATEADWQGLHSILTDPLRPLPGGTTVGALAGDRFKRLVIDSERALFRTQVTANERGHAYVLTLLALHAGLSYKGWYGTPWWPDVVDVFVERLSNPGPSEALPQVLLAEPDSLDEESIEWCLGRGLAHGAPFAGFARWRLRREPGWVDPSPGLSEG